MIKTERRVNKPDYFLALLTDMDGDGCFSIHKNGGFQAELVPCGEFVLILELNMI